MRIVALAALVASALLTSAALADEGMWTFDNFPTAAVNAKYGTHVDQAWLDRVRAASVRLSTGCSASIVTGEGLVLTNHHCVRACAQNLSSGRVDYIRDGFSAANREEEKPCPGMQGEVLQSIADVSGRVMAATSGKTGRIFVIARDAEIAAIEQGACANHEDTLRCQVISLYEGGQYKLYIYRKYTDVRLVFAVEGSVAFFGGDPDNFNFPRYDLDCAFVRFYENGVPVQTPQHLTWSTSPPVANAPVFVSGNPGSTDRLLTAEQLEFLRDVSLPDTMILLSELRGRIILFGERSDENARIANEDLFSIENAFKVYHGQDEALIDPALLSGKRRADATLHAKTANNAALAREIGDPWADIAKVQTDRRAIYKSYTYMEARAGVYSDLFSYARTLVRAADERTRPNNDRLPEYTDSRLPLLQKRLLDPEPVYPALEQVLLEFWLSKLRENLTADAPGTKTFLGKGSPEDISARLATSRLGDPAVRKQLWDGGAAAIRASVDPMIRYVVATDGASRAVRRQYEDLVIGPTERAAQRLAKARFAIDGTSDYPDATFSLRLSYGRIAGWSENGVPVPPFTYFAGLWDRATGQFPFALPPAWIDAKSRVNPDTVFDFVTDNDVVGGSSGSPVVDAKGDVIGAAFDGNIHSLGGAYGFDGAMNRSIAVSTVAITEALANIYGNHALVAELTAR